MHENSIFLTKIIRDLVKSSETLLCQSLGVSVMFRRLQLFDNHVSISS